MYQKILVLLLVGGFCLIGPIQSVQAQTANKILPDKIKYKTKKKDGWFPDLKVGFNFSFAQSDGVVGVQDGTTLSLGLQLSGSLVYTKRTHEWRTTLGLIHTQTKLPTLEPFVKSADKLDLETIYVYRLPKVKWFGFFVGLKMETPILPGFLLKSDDVTLQIKEPTEKTYKPFAEKPKLAGQEGFQLTNAFAPLALKQALGLDFLPLNHSVLRVNIKAGVGAVQLFAQNGLRIDADKSATDKLIQLGRLQDYVQIGAEARLNAGGSAFKKLLSYSLSTGVMLPFYSSVTNGKSIPELINFDLAFKLGIQVFKWLAINYALNITYAPLIVPEKFQVTNNLVLSLTWNVL